ncbi:MAG: hypothetical protein GWN71_21745 [Gammaproteobacteria bacterium]|nr:hypothetical protein [Gemmatimonadota bacterium]NIR35066.1 hypothetical protein [Actinomycetota bacterium]NIU76092.1 hypothetical protein [Gammaproteobacteria bacterium]NIY09943.1 hypothetical protein [Gemmatimonadota bacterium]
MSLIPLALALALYLWVAASRALVGDWPGVVIWTSYAAANAGFIWSYRP